MRTFNIVTLALIAVAAAACSKKPDPASGSPSAPSPQGSAAASAEPVASAAPSASGPSPIALTLGARLVKEAQTRPHIQPNADDVLAAFAKTGGALTGKTQGLAATYKASFCEGGTVDGSVGVSICEYADDDSTKAGLAALQSLFPAKQARHVLHKNTVLTTLRVQDGPAAQALETKLVAAYTAL